MLALTTVPASAQPAAELQYLYDDLGQLVKVVDAQGNVLEYVYDPTGNLLEVRRSLAGPLAILDFAPRQGPVGTTVELRGRGFSPVSAENTVLFGTTPATVLEAAGTRLRVEVPAGASTSPISVAVGPALATTTDAFVVLDPPTISSLTPHILASDATQFIHLTDLRVTGTHLDASMLRFQPMLVPLAVEVTEVTPDPGGLSATLGMLVRPDAAGVFVLEARSADGTSGLLPHSGNTLEILPGAEDADGDGLTNAQEIALGTNPHALDTDGDGFSDGDEVAFGSAPTNPASRPVDPYQSVGEVVGLLWSSLNVALPATPFPLPGEVASTPFSARNDAAPVVTDEPPGEAVSALSSMLNLTAPDDGTDLPAEIVSPLFSLLNQTPPSTPVPLPGESVGFQFSLQNTAGRTPATTMIPDQHQESNPQDLEVKP